MIQLIYSALWPLARRGWGAMRRFCWLLGMASDLTDRNILRALEVEGDILQQIIRASVMIGWSNWYHIMYWRPNPVAEVSHVTRVEYIPPRDSGQISISDDWVTKWYVLGEMIYQKNMTIQLLNTLNKHRVSGGDNGGGYWTPCKKDKKNYCCTCGTSICKGRGNWWFSYVCSMNCMATWWQRTLSECTMIIFGLTSHLRIKQCSSFLPIKSACCGGVEVLLETGMYLGFLIGSQVSEKHDA